MPRFGNIVGNRYGKINYKTAFSLPEHEMDYFVMFNERIKWFLKSLDVEKKFSEICFNDDISQGVTDLADDFNDPIWRSLY
ncbi:MAG: hypothetical protein QXU18_14730 [Thermoplasmatales archaeon]